MKRFLFLFLALLALALPTDLKAQPIVQLTDSPTIWNFPATVSGDGRRVFYLRWKASRSGGQMGMLLMRQTGSAVPEVLAENVRADWILANQDGSRVIFGAHQPAGIATLNVETKAVIRHTNVALATGYGFGYPRWVTLAEGAATIIASSDVGIIAIPWDGGEVERLSLPGTRYVPLVADPQGRVIFYSNGQEVLKLDKGKLEPTRVASLGSVSALFITPDGGTLLLYSDGGRIFRHDVAARRTEELFPNVPVALLDVSRDGRWMLIASASDVSGENPDRSPELFLVSVDLRVRRQLTNVNDGGFLIPWSSPPARLNDDGSSAIVLSTVRLPGPSRSAFLPVYLYRATTTEKRFELLDIGSRPEQRQVKVLSDGSHIVFLSSSRTDVGFHLVLARSDGTHSVPLTADLGRIYQAAVSGDGSMLAFPQATLQQGNVMEQLWVQDRASGQRFKIAEVNTGPPCFGPNAFHCFPRPYLGPSVLDVPGKTLVFASSKVGTQGQAPVGSLIYVADLSRRQLQLIQGGTAPDISDDGRLISFEGSGEVFVSRADGSERRKVGSGSGHRMSADGRWLAFLRDGQIVLAASDGTSERKVTSIDTSRFVFSSTDINADGSIVVGLASQARSSREIFFSSYDRTGLEIGRFELRGREDTPYSNFIGSWCLDPAGQRVYFSSPAEIFSSEGGDSIEIFSARLQPTSSWLGGLDSVLHPLAGLSISNLDATAAPLSMTSLNADGTILRSSATKLLPPKAQQARLLQEHFGSDAEKGPVSVEVISQSDISSFALMGSGSLDKMQGLAVSETVSTRWLFSLSQSLVKPGSGELGSLVLFNPHTERALVDIRSDSPFANTLSVEIAPKGTAAVDVFEKFLGTIGFFKVTETLLRVSCSLPIQARLEILRGDAAAVVPGVEQIMTAEELLFAHAVSGADFETSVFLMNANREAVDVSISLFDAGGRLHPQAAQNPLRRTIPRQHMLEVSIREMALSEQVITGYFSVQTLEPVRKIAGIAVISGRGRGGSLLSVGANRPLSGKTVIAHIVQDDRLFTGYAIVNPYEFPLQVTIEVFDASATSVGKRATWLPAHGQEARLISDFVAQNHVGGYAIVSADLPISIVAALGTASGSALAEIPIQ